MVGNQDRVIRTEELTLYAIILAFIGLATAFLVFGISQLKILEVWMPYIYISIGVVYIAIAVALITSLRKSSVSLRPTPYRPYSEGPSVKHKLGTVFNRIGIAIVGAVATIVYHLRHDSKVRFGALLILAFVAGSFITSTIGSNFNLNLNFNFSLPTIQFPSLGNQSAVSGAFLKFEAKKVPTAITDFSVSKSGESYTLSFSLADKDSEKVNASGNATFKVTDQSGKILYEESFEVFEPDFLEHVYKKSIDASKIKKSTSSNGVANIKFITSGGSELSGNASMEVPVLSDAELATMYQTEYASSAKTVDKSVTPYQFKVTLTKMGFFKKVESGVTKTYYRVDLLVENTFAVAEEFKTSTARLTVGGTSYSPDALSTLKTETLKGKQINEGYLLFKDVPSNISGTVKVRAGTASKKGLTTEEVEYNFEVSL